MNGRLKQGLYPFRAPIGYRDNGRGKEKTICPVKGPQVRQVLERYATGTHSMRSLRAEAERLGLRGHTGRPLTLHGIEAILANPFYAGMIEIKRTGATFDGIHQPLIGLSTFRRIQAIKSGRAGKKVTKHNHTYRGLIRCGHCDRGLSPELQKGHVYYRCHTVGCPTTTIREDRFDCAVQERLVHFEISESDAATLIRDFKVWIGQRDHAAEQQSIDLRIGQTTARMDRLTDLMIEGTIDADTYHQRKRDMRLAIAQLHEDRAKLEENDQSADNAEKFFELMKIFTQLHRSAKDIEKRQMVEICFSNRILIGKKLELEPQNWLQVVKNLSAVTDGDPQRHTIRTRVRTH